MGDSRPPHDSVGRLPLRESRGGGRHGGQEAKADEATRGPTRRVPAEEIQERRRHPRSEGEVRQQRVQRVSRPRAAQTVHHPGGSAEAIGDTPEHRHRHIDSLAVLQAAHPGHQPLWRTPRRRLLVGGGGRRVAVGVAGGGPLIPSRSVRVGQGRPTLRPGVAALGHRQCDQPGCEQPDGQPGVQQVVGGVDGQEVGV